jgi:Kdo2-lipid IVA 3' secondary acyltransferase
MQKIKTSINFVLGLLLRAVVSLLFRTLRLEVHGLDEFQERAKKNSPLIIALWHNNLLLLGPIMNKFTKNLSYTILISKSRDGNIPSFFAKTYPKVEVIRVGHKTRHIALMESLTAIENGRILVLTPDGPRGPACVVKPGVVFSAQKAQADVVAFSWHASKMYRLKSWDRFCIPMPFSKLHITFSPAHSFEKASIDDAKTTLETVLSKNV